MSLFDDVIVNAAAAVDAVGKKATEVVDRSRVRVSSAELKNKISAQFETLGRYVYDTHVSGNTDQNVVNQYVGEITVLINELKTLQDTLTAASGKIVCPRCCCANSYDSLFCKKCGTTLDFTNTYTVSSQPIPQPVQETETKVQEPTEDTSAEEISLETETKIETESENSTEE